MANDNWQYREPFLALRDEIRQDYATKEEVKRLIAEAKEQLQWRFFLFLGIIATAVTAIIRLT